MNNSINLTQRDIVLIGLTPAKGAEHTPVQAQKLFFLIDKNLSDLLGGPFFNFHPYNYGPFDKNVYIILEELSSEGLVDIIMKQSYKCYKLSVSGQMLGEELINNIPQIAKDYIEQVSKFVRELSFTQLISAIYRDYPEMSANSVFQG
jgi:hypothetical protein